MLLALNDVNLRTHWSWKCYKRVQKKEATGSYGVAIHRAARTSSGHPRVWAAAVSVSLRPQSASCCPSLSRFLVQSSVRESLHPGHWSLLMEGISETRLRQLSAVSCLNPSFSTLWPLLKGLINEWIGSPSGQDFALYKWISITKDRISLVHASPLSRRPCSQPRQSQDPAQASWFTIIHCIKLIVLNTNCAGFQEHKHRATRCSCLHGAYALEGDRY